jgi:transposase InsO family protein
VDGGNVTRTSILELASAVRFRYRKASKAQKGVILNEFCAATGYHRKAAIRLLNRAAQQLGQGRRGRPPVYQWQVFRAALALLWEAAGYICSKRLAPFMAQLLDSLERHNELVLEAEVRQRLVQMSPATIDRLLRPVRHYVLRRPHVSRPTVASLRDKIATHTFAELKVLPLGHLEVDLVLHCGMTTEGFYLTTLVGVDIVSSWCECAAVWGKGQSRVGGAVDCIRRRLPFPLLGVHSDNGSEFINQHMHDYCHGHGLDFTHSRPYRKNDLPRVEQRNGSLVRQLIGHGRYASHAAHAQLNRIYELVRLHSNFFQPVCKLVGHERRGARVIKRYDRAETPYQRLLATNQLSEQTALQLEELYRQLNPLQLQRDIESESEKLWRLEAVDPTSQRIARSMTVLSLESAR